MQVAKAVMGRPGDKRNGDNSVNPHALSEQQRGYGLMCGATSERGNGHQRTTKLDET